MRVQRGGGSRSTHIARARRLIRSSLVATSLVGALLALALGAACGSFAGDTSNNEGDASSTDGASPREGSTDVTTIDAPSDAGSVDASDATVLCSFVSPLVQIVPVAIDPVPIVSIVPRLSRDELAMYWEAEVDGGGDYDIFTANRTSLSDPFTNVHAIAGVNSTAIDGYPSIDDTGTLLIFESTRAKDSFDGVYLASRAAQGDNWTVAPAPIAFTDGDNTGQPYLSIGSSTVYYITNPEADTDYDIYSGSLNGGALGSAAPVASLNSVGAANAPALSQDELHIVFQVSGTSYEASRATIAAPFGNPKIATAFADAGGFTPTWFSVDNCRAYGQAAVDGGFALFVATHAPD